MTMYADDISDLFDSLEMDEFDERARPGRAGVAPLRTPGQGSSFQARPQAKYVTEAQLQAAVRTLDGKIATLGSNVKTLEGRARTLATEQDKLETALRKEMAERRKEQEALRKDLQQTRELSAILPILTNPGGGMGSILPAMLLMGSGTGSGGSDNSMMMLAMVMALGNK